MRFYKIGLFHVLFFATFRCIAQYSNIEYSNALVDDIRIYQNVLSAALGSQCAMYPSCSNYGIEVFQKKTAIMGFVLTADRLMRCGNDLGHYKRISIGGSQRVFDLPDESNRLLAIGYHYDWIANLCKEYSFVCDLLEKQHYDEALLEIYRLQYDSRTDSSFFCPDLSYLEAYCYLLKNELHVATAICSDRLKSEWDIHFAEILADCQYMSRQYEMAGETYKALKDSSVYDGRNAYSRKLVLVNAALEKYESARAILRQDVNRSIEAEKQIERLASARYLNANKARILSIIPGLGYWYCKQPKTALTAFLFNGMTLYATYDLLKQGQYGMGILMTAMSMSFYVGNIYGSGRSVKKYNLLKREKLLEPIESWAFSN